MGSNYLAAIGQAAPALTGMWRDILAEERAGKKFKMEEQLQPARIEREQAQTALTQEHVNQLRQQNVAIEKQRKIDESPANLKEMLGKIGLFPETQDMVLGQGEVYGIKDGLGTTKQVKEFATKFLEGPHGLKIMQSTAENYSQLYKEAREGYEKISKPDTEGAMKDPNDPSVQKAYKKMKEYEGKASMFGGITLKMRDYFETRDAIEELKNMPGGKDFTAQQIAILQLAGKTGGKAEIGKVGLEILKENSKVAEKPLADLRKNQIDRDNLILSLMKNQKLTREQALEHPDVKAFNDVIDKKTTETTKSTEQLVREDLENRLGRKATAGEVLKEMENREVRITGEKRKPEDVEKEKRTIGKDAAVLRKEFTNLKEVKDFKEVRSKFQVMQEALNASTKTNNFVAVDQALITLFNKMTDPQSVVRESEYARTPKDLAFINKIKGKVSKILSGGAGLTQDERNALVDMSKNFRNVYAGHYKNSVVEYRKLAKMSGLDPNMIVEEEKQSGQYKSMSDEELLKELEK